MASILFTGENVGSKYMYNVFFLSIMSLITEYHLWDLAVVGERDCCLNHFVHQAKALLPKINSICVSKIDDVRQAFKITMARKHTGVPACLIRRHSSPQRQLLKVSIDLQLFILVLL